MNGLKLFAEPSLAMTTMKKIVTTTIEISASTSWLRTEIRTPKYSTAVISAMTISVQAQAGSGFTLNSDAMVACRYPPMSRSRPVISTVTPT